jgi:hypothetical protein
VSNEDARDARRTARVTVNKLVTVGSIDDAGELDMRERRLVEIGVGGCAIRGEALRPGTHVAVFVMIDLIIVGRAIPMIPGEDILRVEWSVDDEDARELGRQFGV